MEFLAANNYYLIGIKGVAMTALAQCLVEAGKKVSGADVAEDFVTAKQLARFKLNIDHDFSHPLPSTAEVIIYSGAHGGITNPLVKQAIDLGLPVFSHAKALAELFNYQSGWAICGTNGKSTVSAILAFVLSKLSVDPSERPSFSVGVGEILGLNCIGQYNPNPESIFIAEADEYAEDVTQIDPKVGVTQARFSYLKPQLIIANNLSWDHPDVYLSLGHTQEIFLKFFQNLKINGSLIANHDDQNLMKIVNQLSTLRPDIRIITFGKNASANLNFVSNKTIDGQSLTKLIYQNHLFDKSTTSQSIPLELIIKIPGDYNIMNCLAALTALLSQGYIAEDILPIFKQFASTQRRYELLGQKNGVTYIDDYAHHPDEITAVIDATRIWYPNHRLIVGFQSHTYTRTIKLFNEFALALSAADKIIMTDIFPSARESASLAKQVSSDDLCQAINNIKSSCEAQNLKDNHHLATWCQKNLLVGDIFLSLGAGDIYHFFEYI